MLRTVNNKLRYSYDGEVWNEISEYIAAWFRYQDNKIQISRDQKTWSDLSKPFTQDLYIKGYVATSSALPSTGVKQGDIYMVGPTYAAEDTEHKNPIYRMYVYNDSGWVDNGVFQSIAAGVVQTIGNSETEVMSQKAVSSIVGLDTYPVFSDTKPYVKGEIVNYGGLLYEFTADHEEGAWIGTDARETSLREEKINKASRLVETYSGVHIPPNKPIIGEHVFTQCAGVHADGDSKNNLYCNDLLPERFGRVREYALGKTSGKANIRKNLEALGIDMDEGSMRKVTERIIELGDKKEMVTPEDLPYIISDVLHHDNALEDQKIRILNYSLSLAQGLKPVATLKIEINGEAYEESASGDGQYDAFVRALRRIYSRLNRPFPMLTNYSVSIPPGGRTDAFVQTVISWNYAGVDFKTRGLDADQTEAAIKATLKMLNKIED